MTLTTYEHELVGRDGCRHVKRDDHYGDWCDSQEAIAAIEAARLEFPPGSLQWAIASGRPFRRKAWFVCANAGWVRGLGDEEQSFNEFFYYSLVFTSLHGHAGVRACADDITATDYELKEGGD